jgi:hypothetical protein
MKGIKGPRGSGGKHEMMNVPGPVMQTKKKKKMDG